MLRELVAKKEFFTTFLPPVYLLQLRRCHSSGFQRRSLCPNAGIGGYFATVAIGRIHSEPDDREVFHPARGHRASSFDC